MTEIEKVANDELIRFFNRNEPARIMLRAWVKQSEEIDQLRIDLRKAMSLLRRWESFHFQVHGGVQDDILDDTKFFLKMTRGDNET